jgi:hypothetical protein
MRPSPCRWLVPEIGTAEALRGIPVTLLPSA